MWLYAWGIAADVVAKGSAPKPDADAVTRGMTASVVSCTLWVVALELVRDPQSVRCEAYLSSRSNLACSHEHDGPR